MSLVPRSGPNAAACRKRLAEYRKRLAAFKRVPARWREAEHADLGEETCLALIAELEKQLKFDTRVTDQTDPRGPSESDGDIIMLFRD